MARDKRSSIAAVQSGKQGSTLAPAISPQRSSAVLRSPWGWAAAVAIAVAFGWSYWPTLVELVSTWDREPDYSHGFIVPPIAVLFLWVRRKSFPGFEGSLSWFGLAVLLLGAGVRALGGVLYLPFVDGWSMLLWVTGIAWLFCGRRVVWWGLPSIIFLIFMIPLPFSAERILSVPLQRIATQMSCWTLQSLGQACLAEGNTIMMGEYRLEVEQACSGLRLFVGIAALGFAYLVIVHRPRWQKAILIVSILPIALVSNAMRIVVTGLMYQWISEEAAQKFTHDVAGWAMVLFATTLFGLVLFYLSRLVREVEVLDPRSALMGGESGWARS